MPEGCWSEVGDMEAHEQLVQDIRSVYRITSTADRYAFTLRTIASRVATHKPKPEWCCTMAMAANDPDSFRKHYVIPDGFTDYRVGCPSPIDSGEPNTVACEVMDIFGNFHRADCVPHFPCSDEPTIWEDDWFSDTSLDDDGRIPTNLVMAWRKTDA